MSNKFKILVEPELVSQVIIELVEVDDIEITVQVDDSLPDTIPNVV